jgi:hypothetical protein
MFITMLLSLAIQAPDARPLPPATSASIALPAGHVHEVVHLVSITGKSLELLRLARLDLDTVTSKLAEGEVVVLARDGDVEAIRDLGLTATIQIEDLAWPAEVSQPAARQPAARTDSGSARSSARAAWGATTPTIKSWRSWIR